jgi:hypothetical protein
MLEIEKNHQMVFTTHTSTLKLGEIESNTNPRNEVFKCGRSPSQRLIYE